MKTKIDRIHYANLWNSEFPLVAERTICICEKYDMQSLMLDKSFNELLSFRPQIQAFTIYVRKYAKITAAGLLDSERDTLINSIVKTVKALEAVDLPQIRPHVETLDTLLSKHKAKTMAADGLTSETERLTILENDIAVNPEAKAALDALNLQDITDRLFVANKEYETIFQGYIAERSAEERIDIPTLRRECTKALVQLFEAIQYCAYANDAADYSGLIREINQLNNYYIQQLKARETRRKNGRKVTDEQPIPEPEE